MSETYTREEITKAIELVTITLVQSEILNKQVTLRLIKMSTPEAIINVVENNQKHNDAIGKAIFTLGSLKTEVRQGFFDEVIEK